MRGVTTSLILLSILALASQAIREAPRRIADCQPGVPNCDLFALPKREPIKRDADYYKRFSQKRHRYDLIRVEGRGDDIEGYDGAAIRQSILGGTCPHRGSVRCPAPGGVGAECVNAMSNSKSCGGCSTPDMFGFVDGTDCTALENVKDARCVRGTCRIRRCVAGYKLVQNMEDAAGGYECVEV